MTGDGWPSMPLLRDELLRVDPARDARPTPPLSDDLLRVHGIRGAREALRAAEGIRVFDGPATAWLVVGRAVEVSWFVALFLAATRDSLWHEWWLWLAFAGLCIVFVATEGPLARRAGAQPARWSWRWRFSVPTIAMASYTLLRVTEPTAPEAVDPALVAVASGVGLGYLIAPVARWAGARRHPRGLTPWPPGAEAFAVLSVLARARTVHPDRLVTLTGLSPERCDAWVWACAVRGLALPDTRRLFVPRGAEITASGRTCLEGWTAELTDLATGAQPWTSSTAPTSPAVSSDRSSSDVT